jgi:alpha-tubulin suppressor-like RCC1 family protein
MLARGATRPLRQAGEVYSMGAGFLGCLGNGSYADAPEPHPVRALAGGRAKAVATAWGAAMAVGEDGSLAQWGWRAHIKSLLFAIKARRRNPRLVRVVQTSALLAPLGRLALRGAETEPKLWPGFGAGGAHRVEFAGCGGEFCAALTDDGGVWTWGAGVSGQLGHGRGFRESFSHEPRRVAALSDRRIKRLGVGFQHLAAVDEEDAVWTWGRVSNAALGIYDDPAARRGEADYFSIPKPVNVREHNAAKGFEAADEQLPRGIRDVACGMNHTLYLLRDGTVWANGRGFDGVLGSNDAADAVVPRRVQGVEGVVSIASGQHHVVAMTADGQVLTWGLSNSGQCGRSEFGSGESVGAVRRRARGHLRTDVDVLSFLPGRVALPELGARKPARVFAGHQHTGVLLDSGELLVCGGGSHEWRLEPQGDLQGRIISVAFGFDCTLFTARPAAS